ncbi:zinc metalloproteinase nas-13-like isoform X2 [Periplaneta americana]
MAVLGIYVLLLISSAFSFPLEDENALQPEIVMFRETTLYDEQVVREAGLRVANWKNDSEINPEELGPYTEGDIMMQNTRNGLTAQSARWPKGIVPYEIAGYFSSADLGTIHKAMEEYHKRTCIRFVPRKRDNPDYLVIVSDNTGCWSSVGRVGGPQKVNLQSPGCLTTLGTPVHELMHAVGFVHEQNRYERDHHVSILWENIQPGRQNNFEKAKKGQTDGQGVDYDYRSVMHYSANAFSKNGKPTIVPKISGVKIGQRDGFSRGDVQKIRHMYDCKVRRPGA